MNISILGYSSISERKIIPTLEKSKKLNLFSIGTSRHQAFKANNKYKFNSYDEVIEDRDVDLLYVSTTNDKHFPLAKKALQNGKSVIIEKPIVLNLNELDELTKEAEKNDCTFIENLAFIYHPAFQRIKEIIANNYIGELVFIDSTFCYPHMDDSNFRYKSDKGGGAELDCLIYPLTTTFELLGYEYNKIDKVKFYNQIFNVDSHGAYNIAYENASSRCSYGMGLEYENSIKIIGTKGKIFVERLFSAPSNLKLIISLTRGNINEKIEIEESNFFSLLFDDFADNYKNKEFFENKLYKSRKILEAIQK